MIKIELGELQINLKKKSVKGRCLAKDFKEQFSLLKEIIKGDTPLTPDEVK